MRIIDGNLLTKEQKDEGPRWIPDMDSYSGKEATIKDIQSNGWVRLKEFGWQWLPEWLERLV